ncbi:FecR family protein [Alistipes shahii]|uniref:FecR family protein n=1 Tax=Alistipes shahii TaxID=328814 RepID=UPI0026774438|nr:FecR domain-containing protein [Alistipes shahii]
MKKNFNLIGKYLRGDASLAERIQVMKWAEGNDTQRDEFNALRRIYDATLLMDDDIAMSKRRTGLRRYWKWLAAAAVIAFVAGISYLPENFRDDPTPHLQFRSLSAPIGQQTKTVLSDGTVVWLNSGSELEICAQAEGERRVKLCGEAYLDVARDIDRPFIVETSHMEVRVLGTRFNVNAYDEKQSVVLVSGSVDVTALEQGESSRIRPEEMFTYDACTGERQIRLVDTNNFVSWTEGFLQFKSAPLEQVFMQLQHFYGVRINCDSHLTEEITISGKLELRTGLESALNHLKLLAPISYTRSGEREIDITIRQ